MAKRRRARTQIVRSFPMRAPAPIIRVQSSSPRPAKKRHHRRRSSGGKSGGRGLVAGAIGGAIFGFIEKQFPNLPTLPIVGRAGTVAIAGHFLGPKLGSGMGGLIRDVTYAAAVIAGYELGSTGKISGDADHNLGGGVASQI